MFYFLNNREQCSISKLIVFVYNFCELLRISKFVDMRCCANKDYEDSAGQRCVMLAQYSFKARRERYLTRHS